MLGELATQMNAGQLRPVVGAVHPLAEGHEAFASKQAGPVPGRSSSRLPVEVPRLLGARGRRVREFAVNLVLRSFGASDVGREGSLAGRGFLGRE